MSDFAKKLCIEVDSRFAESASKELADRTNYYFKNTLKNLYGSTADTMDKVIRAVRPICKKATAAELYEGIHMLLKTGIYENQLTALKLLSVECKKFVPKEAFVWVHKRTDEGLVSNWACLDEVAMGFMGYLISVDESLAEITKGWVDSKNMWVRRLSVVPFVKLARYGKFLDIVYDNCSKMMADDEYYVNKAVGWALREAGKTDEKRLEHFLLKFGNKTSRITLRYAIEKFEKGRRKFILEETKNETI